jgi:hypothetical protein
MNNYESLADNGLPDVFRSKVMLVPSAIITTCVGVAFIWLTFSRVPIWRVFRLVIGALIYWYAAYRTWQLSATTYRKRRHHLAHFVIALWGAYFAMTLVLILLELYPAKIYPESLLVFAVSVLACALAVHFLTTTNWGMRIIDVLYVIVLVVFAPILGLLMVFALLLSFA